MADLSYDVQVNTSQAERNLTNLQKSVAGLNNTFAGLKTALAGISLGAIISQAIGLADSITDISDSTGIATANILGLSRAMIDNGGSAEGAQKAILKLVGAIGEAADGGEDTQKAFASIGISLNDLRTLSEQDILSKTIAGLANISDASQRSVLSTRLLGKEIRNVGLAGVAGSYAQATAESAKYAAAVKSAADAQGAIDKTLTDFKIAVLDAIRPITELVASLNVGVEGFRKFIQAVVAVGAAIASFLLIGRIIRLFVLLFEAVVAIVSSGKNLLTFLKELANGWRALYASTEGVGGVFARILLSIEAVGKVIVSTLGPAFTTIKAVAIPVLAGLAGYWGYVQESTTAAINTLKEYLNYLPGVNFDIGGGAGRGDGQAEMAQRKKDAEERAKKEKELREVRDKAAEREMDRIRKFNSALTAQQKTYSSLNSEAQTFSNYLMSDLKFQTSLLGMTEDQKEIATALNAETQRYLQEQNTLQSKLSNVQSQIGAELKSQKSLKDDELAASKDKVQLLTDEESRLKELSKTYYDLHISNGKNLESELKQQQQIKNTEAERLSNLEYISERLREQAASYESLGGALRSINDKRVDLKVQTDQTGLSPLRKQIATINEEARKAALEAGRAFSANFESEDGLTPERAEELAAGLSQIADGYKAISNEQIKALGVSDQYLSGNLDSLSAWREEFRVGSKDAFTKFKEDATDAGKQAADSFSTFTSGMEDAFVQFVQTGKLSFKSLANSIIADLVRIAVRRAIVAAIGGPLGMLFGGGRSAGGSVAGGTSYVVGERGPELFVPQSAGKIISNSALKGSGSNTGGTSGGGTTVVNYNIQAVDASSFRSLVAKDPSFIYAVTEQGRRSQPTRSR
jgi:lambda family phage tail tape measure protein